jgi:hypothetical protein
MEISMKIMHDLSMSICLAGALLAWSPPTWADDCTSASDAAIAQAKVPHAVTHMMTRAGKPPEQIEMVFKDDKAYTQMHGAWQTIPFSAQQQIDSINASREHSEKTSHTCEKLTGQTVNGEASSLYVVHTNANGKISDARVWISDTSGLPLKSEIHLDGGTTITDEFRYGDIQAPPGVK